MTHHHGRPQTFIIPEELKLAEKTMNAEVEAWKTASDKHAPCPAWIVKPSMRAGAEGMPLEQIFLVTKYEELKSKISMMYELYELYELYRRFATLFFATTSFLLKVRREAGGVVLLSLNPPLMMEHPYRRSTSSRARRKLANYLLHLC